MKVTVKVYGTLRPLLGNELELEVPGRTLEELVEEMTRQKGKQVKEELLDEEGRLDYAYIIFINGNRISDLAATLPEEAKVTITNQFGGGQEIQQKSVQEPV